MEVTLKLVVVDTFRAPLPSPRFWGQYKRTQTAALWQQNFTYMASSGAIVDEGLFFSLVQYIAATVHEGEKESLVYSSSSTAATLPSFI